MIQVKNGGRLTAAAWQIDQTGETPSAPANVSTTTTTNGSFDLSLPADSVTTLVVTAPASSYPSYTTHDAQTGRCLVRSMADDAVRRQNRLDLLLEINSGSAQHRNRRQPDEQLAGHGQISLVMPGRGTGCTGWLIFHSSRAGNRTSCEFSASSQVTCCPV